MRVVAKAIPNKNTYTGYLHETLFLPTSKIMYVVLFRNHVVTRPLFVSNETPSAARRVRYQQCDTGTPHRVSRVKHVRISVIERFSPPSKRVFHKYNSTRHATDPPRHCFCSCSVVSVVSTTCTLGFSVPAVPRSLVSHAFSMLYTPPQ